MSQSFQYTRGNANGVKVVEARVIGRWIFLREDDDDRLTLTFQILYQRD
jgi:hypothetical protein